MSVRVHAGKKLRCLPFFWLNGELPHLGVVLKARFRMVPAGRMEAMAPAEIVCGEGFERNNPGRGLAVPDDLVPHLPQAEVVMQGTSYGEAGLRQVRLAVERNNTLVLNKRLQVTATSKAPVRLSWHHALQGPSNPFGRPEPTIVDLQYPEQPGCFLPVTKHAAARQNLLAGLPMPRRRNGWMNVPASLDWGFFQSVPENQRLERLDLTERLILEGLHPEVARVESQLPGLRAYVYIRYSEVQPWVLLPVTADRLLIDAESLSVAVTWRGAVAFENAASMNAVRLYAELAMCATDVRPDIEAVPAETMMPPPESDSFALNHCETLALDNSDHSRAAQAADQANRFVDHAITLTAEEPSCTESYLPFRPALEKNEGSPPGSIRAPQLLPAEEALPATPAEPPAQVRIDPPAQAQPSQHEQVVYRVRSDRDMSEPPTRASSSESSPLPQAVAPKRPPPVDVAAKLYGSFD
jgi:hypothetical protein